MTDSLVARLREAIDETERIAQAAGGTWALEGDRDELLLDFGTHTTSDIGFYEDDMLRPAEARHIARHDPAAVLRRCAADRKILDLHAPSEYRISYGIPRTVLQCDHCASLCHSGSGLACDSPDAPYPCETVQIVAEAYGVEA